MSLSSKAKAKVLQIVGITVLQGKGRKFMLHDLGHILLSVNMGIIEQIAQDGPQCGEEEGKGQTFIQARRRLTPLPNIRSLMSLSSKAKAKIWEMVGITVLQGNLRKVVLHRLGPIFLPVNMGIIEQVVQDEL